MDKRRKEWKQKDKIELLGKIVEADSIADIPEVILEHYGEKVLDQLDVVEKTLDQAFEVVDEVADFVDELFSWFW